MACKPRVIAAEIKKDFSQDVFLDKPVSKPHIAGVVSLVGGTSAEPHYAEVRDGQLLLYPGLSPRVPPVWRLSLRHLHLQPAASGRPRGFSLTRHHERNPIATFQVDSELEYSRWVKTLAAELLKQTPLEAVKYLDILGITASLPRQGRETRSLSPEGPHSLDSWDLRTPPRTWPPPSYSQPLSLVITEEPKKRSLRKALNFDSSPEDSVDGRCHVRMVDCFRPRSCFRSCVKTPVVDESRVKTLLKTFVAAPLATSPTPAHSQDMKDDGRISRPPLPDVVKDLPPCDRQSRPRARVPNPARHRGKSVDVLPSSEDYRVAKLIAHCRQEDRYVPVKEKRMMFESLGRAASQPRFVFSSDNLACIADLPAEPTQPRAQSMHDLTANTSVAVKEICRYFEQRGDVSARSPSPECRQRLCRSQGRPLDWRFRQHGDCVPRNIRNDRHLQKDRERLKKLQEDLSRLQREVDSSQGRFGIVAQTVRHRHQSDVR